MAKHYLYGPSTAHRWLACPGEPAMRLSCPERGNSKDADEGTAAHWVAAQVLLGKGQIRDYAGHRGEETKWVTVTSEMLDNVRIYVAECQRIIDLSCWWQVEVRVEIREDFGGTSDFQALSKDGKTFYVRDYKNGVGVPVASGDNPQLMLYALFGIKHLYGTEKYKKENWIENKIKMIDMAIVQPRVSESINVFLMEGKRLSEWYQQDLAQAFSNIDKATKDLTTPGALVAGSHCKFCPAKAVCPAQMTRNLAAAQIDFADIEVRPKPVAQLTIEQIVQILAVKEDIESWLASVEAHAKSELMKGRPVPGYKLVRKKSNRRWTEKALKELPLVFGAAAYTQPVPELVSVVAAENILKDLGDTLDKSWTEKPDTGETIAPMSDPRTEVKKTSAEEQFADMPKQLEDLNI